MLWCCGACGATFPLGDVGLGETLEPCCPERGCAGSGFGTVAPATHLYD